MIIRRATAQDGPAVTRVHDAAFGGAGAPDGTVEARLAQALRDAGDLIPPLSLVAEVDGAVVGSVVGSIASVGGHLCAGLGPLGVLPTHQNRGIGSALLHAVLGAADALDLPLVGLLGDPAYYRRFGFRPGAGLQVEPPDPAWGAHFQVRALSGWQADVTGRFAYAAAFDDL